MSILIFALWFSVFRAALQFTVINALEISPTFERIDYEQSLIATGEGRPSKSFLGLLGFDLLSAEDAKGPRKLREGLSQPEHPGQQNLPGT